MELKITKVHAQTVTYSCPLLLTSSWTWTCKNNCSFSDEKHLSTRLILSSSSSNTFETEPEDTPCCICCLKILTIQNRLDLLRMFFPRFLKQHPQLNFVSEADDREMANDEYRDCNCDIFNFEFLSSLPPLSVRRHFSTCPLSRLEARQDISNLLAICIVNNRAFLFHWWIAIVKQLKFDINFYQHISLFLEPYLKQMINIHNVRLIYQLFPDNRRDSILDLYFAFGEFCQNLPFACLSQYPVKEFQHLMNAVIGNVFNMIFVPTKWGRFNEPLKQCANFLMRCPQYIDVHTQRRYFSECEYGVFTDLKKLFGQIERQQITSNIFALDQMFSDCKHPLVKIHLLPLVLSFTCKLNTATQTMSLLSKRTTVETSNLNDDNDVNHTTSKRQKMMQ